MPKLDLSTSPKAIWRLIWPQMVMMYFMFFMTLTSVWVAGQISADVQASLGILGQGAFFLMVVIMSISSGALAAVSQSLGALKLKRAQRYIATTVFGSLVLGIIMAFLGYAFSESLLKVIMIPESIMPITREIWTVSMITLPAQYIYSATGVMFRATRQVIAPLWVTGIICIINILGCLGFGLGFMGLPNFGYMGIVWTNFGVHCLGAIFNCFLLVKSEYLDMKVLPKMKWLKVGLPYLMKVALPAGAAQLVWQSGYLTLFVLVASLPVDSVNALAGLTAGLRAEGLLILPGMAFNMTVSVLVGNSLGAGKPEQAKKISLNMTAIASFFLTLLAIVLWPFRQEISELLSNDIGTQAQIFSYLTYNFLSTPFSVASTVMGGIMIGAGAPIYNMIVYGGSFWFIRLPLGYLFGHMLWGTSEGIFIAMLISQALQTIIMLYVVVYCNWSRFAMRKHIHKV